MRFRTVACAFLAIAAFIPETQAYSVLTHEAIIDALWDPGFKQLILQHYPAATPDQLLDAHAYAYGGCIIQDVGYYPFGSKLFSDLVHYARSGDFVEALIAEARDPNEYAFALGALAHYAADNNGHPLAVNKAVPILYPKLGAKFGDEVTYAQAPAAHVKTEFGFDVVQIARGRYAPKAYHDFIGFHVSKDLMDRAFEKTYDLRLKDVFGALDLSLGTYRRSVSVLIPEITKAAWAAKKTEILKADPEITRKRFLYALSRSSYEKDWGVSYERPRIGARLIAFTMGFMPKVGPFRSLSFRVPTPATELLFEKSFEMTVDRTRQYLNSVQTGKLKLDNRDFDTGKLAKAGEYTLADKAYAKLLEKLSAQKFRKVTPDLRANIIAFYDGEKPADAKTQAALAALKGL
ncbi:MAG: zinc dependent phospholipase C family protein [Acidobacteriota bacterium]|nr:zinc dependent phospholipase C family protein [Acidobacteriota bacterium]